MRWFRLLLPALCPSWRFFDRIGPAPHVEWSWGASAADAGNTWRPVWQEPAHLPIGSLPARLIWNPARNESLFLVSCAERLLDDPTPERVDRLWSRAADVIRRAHSESGGRRESAPSGYLRVRIVEVTRDGDRLAHEVMYTSEARPL